MSFDALAEQQATIDRLKPLCGGRVYDGAIPEEARLEMADQQVIRPYIIVSFGAVFASQADRSIMDEDQQPHILPAVIECWASTVSEVRVTAGAVRRKLIGWSPGDENASSYRAVGGGFFPSRADSTGRPSRSMEMVSAQTVINMSIDLPEPEVPVEPAPTVPTGSWQTYYDSDSAFIYRTDAMAPTDVAVTVQRKAAGDFVDVATTPFGAFGWQGEAIPGVPAGQSVALRLKIVGTGGPTYSPGTTIVAEFLP